MALKPDRSIAEWNTNLVCNDVAPAGSVLCYYTSGSGAGFREDRGVAKLVAAQSGSVPAGLLVSNFVSIDETRGQHRNWAKTEQVLGEPAPLVRRGHVTTNLVIGSPSAGNPAYLIGSGYVTPTIGAGGLAHTPRVGTFETAKDEDGYCRLYVSLPQ
jgi:hypothetical protein